MKSDFWCIASSNICTFWQGSTGFPMDIINYELFWALIGFGYHIIWLKTKQNKNKTTYFKKFLE